MLNYYNFITNHYLSGTDSVSPGSEAVKTFPDAINYRLGQMKLSTYPLRVVSTSSDFAVSLSSRSQTVRRNDYKS